MNSYKIHSLKDSNKLSFIIEGESENSVQQKLSSEGYIVLSVEKTEPDSKKIFVFEGRKSDKSFIEGKIQAEDIFIAYDMLVRQYGYSISKLHPSSVTDSSEQEKIFQELLSSFEEKKIKSVKIITDTSGKTIQKDKAIIEKLKNIILVNDLSNKDILVADLKKLELTNNHSTTQHTLKTIVKELIFTYRNKKAVYSGLKTIATELGMFVIPNIYFTTLDRLQNFFNFLSPIFRPEEYIPHTVSQKTESKETMAYTNIQKNTHIHTILRKKYTSVSFFQLTDFALRQAYLYSTYRGKSFLFMSSQSLSILGKILRNAIIMMIIGLIVLYFLGGTVDLFVFQGALIVLLGIIILSLVIPGETV